MKKDRLRDDNDRINKPEDIIKARSKGTSHISSDLDAFEEDLDLPDDTDVEEALTFPHPKRRKTEDIELMDTPGTEDLDEDWENRDILPSDYSHGYSEASTTDLRDDPDAMVEDKIHSLAYINPREVGDETPTEIMPDKFTPDEEE